MHPYTRFLIKRRLRLLAAEFAGLVSGVVVWGLYVLVHRDPATGTVQAEVRVTPCVVGSGAPAP